MTLSFTQHFFRGMILLSALLYPMWCSAANTVELDAKFEIQGNVPDMQQHIQSSGFTFSVALQNIQYTGKLHRTVVEPTSDDRLTVWVAMKNAVLTIHNTDIRGRRHSAQCGPVQLVLGSRRDIWIAFELAKKDDQLELLKTRFRLPRDNWSVGAPSWVRTSGFGMTESKVVQGLRGGLVKNAAAVERQLIRVAPEIFAQIEEQIAENLGANQQALSVAMKSKLATRE